MSLRPVWTDDRGSNPVEFVLVGTLLTALTLAVMQLALAVYVHDAAVEGAYYAALADTSPAEGVQRARDVIVRAIGPAYANDITVGTTTVAGRETVDVRVRASLPVFGLIGVPYGLQVVAHAPAESFDVG